MSRRVTAMTPFTEGQLGRFSHVPIRTMLHVEREAPAAFFTYMLATARGSLLTPEGSTTRIVGKRERSPGVLLDTGVRAQLANRIAELHPGMNGPRLLQRHLQVLGEIGLAHRCTRTGPMALYVWVHVPEEPCEWNACPVGTYDLPRTYRTTPTVAANDARGRIEQTPPSLGNPADDSGARDAAISNKAATKAEQRMFGGDLSPEQEQEAMARVMKTLGASRIKGVV